MKRETGKGATQCCYLPMLLDNLGNFHLPFSLTSIDCLICFIRFPAWAQTVGNKGV